MSVPDHVIRYWRAQDAMFLSNQPTWWGAVVTDRRFPKIWDANYARIDRPAPDLTMNDIAEVLVPALRAVGTDVFHVVWFASDGADDLLNDLVGAGHPIERDLVMDLDVSALPAIDPSIVVEPLLPGDELWTTMRETFPFFGEDSAGAVEDLVRLESTVSLGAGKRWFGVRGPDAAVVAVAGITVLEGVGYIDNVATYPQARGRGLASEITLAACRAALTDGAHHVWLMADPDDAAQRIYRRLGFRDAGFLVSTKGPIPDP